VMAILKSPGRPGIFLITSGWAIRFLVVDQALPGAAKKAAIASHT
jgi:hypothetical protein